GDIDSFTPNDPGGFIVTRGATSTSSVTSSYAYDTLSYAPENDCIRMYANDGSLSTDGYSIIGLGRRDTFSYSYAQAAEWADENINTSLSPAFIDNSDYSFVRSEIHPMRRGVMPGMYFAGLSGYSQSELLVVRVLNGVEHILVPSYSAGLMWIKIGDWYD
ncbi:hypothetical protein L2755_22020, partial [Shewanella abyssi]|uniref:hypothetical protein n=1 Tax=Shewanella abyssi TaxID=311789 RepID=UPI00200BDE6D